MKKKITFKERKKVKDILGNILLNIPIKEKTDDFINLINLNDIELNDYIKELQYKITFAKKIKNNIYPMQKFNKSNKKRKKIKQKNMNKQNNFSRSIINLSKSIPKLKNLF